MKSLVVAITLVLSTQFVTAEMKAGSAVNVSDQTRVKCSFVIGSNRTINTPPRKLLDDSALLPTLRAKEKSTTLRADEMMQQTGIRFQENRGQIVDTRGELRTEIAFVANAPGARLYFRNDGISYVFTKTMHTQTIDLPLEGIGSENVSPCGEKITIDPKNVSSWGEIKMGSENVSPWGEIKRGDNQREEIQTYRLDMKLVGCNPFARIRAEGELPGYVNYYLPHCPDGITGIKEYSRIVYENVYDNVDLELFSSNGRMKYNFVVRPGGNVSDIKMKYDGATETALTQDGALAVATPLGRIEEATPYTYSGDESNEVFSRFLRKGNTVSFAVDEYDQSQTLVIDPWATYYGGSVSDGCRGINVDGSGNIIVSGYTASANFPVASGFQSSLAGDQDAFIIKFDVNGTRQWATYYGGSRTDNAARVGTDGNGNIILAGWTASSNFPVTYGAFQTTYAGNGDSFCVKFNTNGIRQWATYYGGDDGDNFGSVTALTNGDIVFCGSTYSKNFPTSPGAYQTTKSKGNHADAFIVKLSSSGSRIWATYYGGKDGTEYAWGICADGNTDIYITGYAPTGFPITVGAFQTVYGGGTRDGFIIKFTNNGARVWASYCGGSGDDQSRGVTADNTNNVVICGFTHSTNFPVSSGAFQTSFGGGFYDAFAMKFTSAGSRIWGTYYGGSGDDSGFEPTIGVSSEIILTGYTTSVNFPVSSGALQTSYAGGDDGFIVKLNSSGTRTWATYFGGAGDDHFFGIDTDSNGNITAAGNTNSTDFPTYSPFQSSNAGLFDAAIASLNANGLFAKRSRVSIAPSNSVILEQNYPNPFNPTTTISFFIPDESIVIIRLYDLQGRFISEMMNEATSAGSHSIIFNGSLLPSGVYYYRLEALDQVRTCIMTLVK